MIAAMYSELWRPHALDLDVLTFPENMEVALRVTERVQQRGRVEHEEAEHAAVSRFLGSAKAKPITGIAKCRRGALDQCNHSSVGNAVVLIGHVGAP
jgi:hypothetical protein